MLREAACSRPRAERDALIAATALAHGLTVVTRNVGDFAAMARGVRGQLQPPEAFVEADWSPAELAFADESLACSAVGSPGAVRDGLQALNERTAADEMVLTAQIFDHAARLKSYALIAQAWGLTRTETTGLGAGA